MSVISAPPQKNNSGSLRCCFVFLLNFNDFLRRSGDDLQAVIAHAIQQSISAFVRTLVGEKVLIYGYIVTGNKLIKDLQARFAIVYIDANENIIRLTRKDFASEEEFQKWKSWSDENYHTEDNRDVVEGKHNMSIDDLSEAALAIPAIDVVMDRQHEKAERRKQASAMVSQIRDKLTETQFRRLWMYYVGGMTVDEIGRIEGIRHQNISKSIGSAMKKIKKFFP